MTISLLTVEKIGEYTPTVLHADSHIGDIAQYSHTRNTTDLTTSTGMYYCYGTVFKYYQTSLDRMTLKLHVDLTHTVKYSRPMLRGVTQQPDQSSTCRRTVAECSEPRQSAHHKRRRNSVPFLRLWHMTNYSCVVISGNLYRNCLRKGEIYSSEYTAVNSNIDERVGLLSSPCDNKRYHVPRQASLHSSLQTDGSR